MLLALQNACSRAALLFAAACLTVLPLRAQDVDVPRTRTIPGVASPAFPMANSATMRKFAYVW